MPSLQYDPSDEKPSSDIDLLEKRELLGAIFERANLTTQQMQTLNMRFTREMSSKQVGEAMGVSRGMVYFLEQAAIKRLRAAAAEMLLEDEDPEIVGYLKAIERRGEESASLVA
jgi:DNA-directed RNA polymerase specialized sigma subunit